MTGPTEKQIEERAEQLARSLWGYFKGGSAGGSTEIAWFDNNKSLGGPAHVIDLCRSALAAALAVEAGAGLSVDALAQEIRRVDGNHSLGAGALAEALMPFLSALTPASSAVEGEGRVTLAMIDRLVEAELDSALSCANGGAPSSGRQQEIARELDDARQAVRAALSRLENQEGEA